MKFNPIALRMAKTPYCTQNGQNSILHSEQPKLHRVLAVLSAIGLKSQHSYPLGQGGHNDKSGC